MGCLDSALDALWPLEVVRQTVDHLGAHLPWSATAVAAAETLLEMDVPAVFAKRLELSNLPGGMCCLYCNRSSAADVMGANACCNRCHCRGGGERLYGLGHPGGA